MPTTRGYLIESTTWDKIAAAQFARFGFRHHYDAISNRHLENANAVVRIYFCCCYVHLHLSARALAH